MRKFILAVGAVATIASAMSVPTLASAYTSRCESQAHNKKVTGTIVGGVLGALAGNAIGHGGGRTGGTIIGGVAGAALGNNLARTHCPDGYQQRVYNERYYDVRHDRYRRGYNEQRCTWREENGPYGPRSVQICS